MLVATSGFWFRKFLKIRGWERMKGAAVRLLPQESLAAVYGVQVVIVVLAGLGSTALLVYNCSLNYTQYSHRYWMVQNSRIQKSEHDRRIEEIIRQREFAPGRRSDAKPASFQR
jgi:hypothetical protein